MSPTMSFHVSPLKRWGHVGSPLSAQFVPQFVYVRSPHSIVQAVKHETLTQCWANVGPPSTSLSINQILFTLRKK